MVRVGLVLLGLLLAGCNAISWPKPPPEAAASASAWTKPGVSGEAVASAYQSCLDLANAATQTDFDIDQDMSATRGSDLQHSEFVRTPMQDTQSDNRDRAQTILSSCMDQKGFSPAK